jgi:ferric-dicitrate binding protein FerR (iron transport regulator)
MCPSTLGVMDIKDEAAAWAVKTEDGLTNTDKAALREWVSRSPKHDRMFRIMRATLRPRVSAMELISRIVVPALGMGTGITIFGVKAMAWRPDLLGPIFAIQITATIAVSAWFVWRFRDRER